MKTIQVSEATNLQLNWLVAKCAGKRVIYCGAGPSAYLAYIPKRSAYKVWRPTTNPIQMWPIIEREGISTVFQGDAHEWVASLWNYNTQDWHMHKTGATPLIAAARCYVMSRLGEEVEVPKELT